MTDSPRLLVIDMVSDLVCPWCYIGFRGLDWAKMALSFNYQVDIRYRPYRLDPETPPEGRDRRTTLERKFPDPVQRAEMDMALKNAMGDVGLDFSVDRPQRLPDTTDAHRLIRWAQEAGLGHDMKAALFEAYWQHGEDIGERDVLVQVASVAELDPEEVCARLATTDDREAVRQEAAEMRRGGINGVPGFIVNELAGFEGALPKAELLENIRILAEETAKMNA